MKNVDGSFKVDCAEAVGRWERYIDELLNDENDNILETVNMVEEPITGVTKTEVGQALSAVKIGKAAGLSEVFFRYGEVSWSIRIRATICCASRNI